MLEGLAQWRASAPMIIAAPTALFVSDGRRAFASDRYFHQAPVRRRSFKILHNYAVGASRLPSGSTPTWSKHKSCRSAPFGANDGNAAIR
jgi:hypothetical protein